MTNNLIKYTVNNSLYFGWGYMESAKSKANQSTGNWEAWTAQTFEITFPSEITSHTRTESSNRTALLQNTTLYLVEENVLYTYMGGEWIKLMEAIQELIDEGDEQVFSLAQVVENANWSGRTPSSYGELNEGTILNNNGVFGEVFNGEDTFLERKGFYNRAFSGTTDLSATTGNEGDIYTKITETVQEIRAVDFAQMLYDTDWQTEICGKVFKFTCDESAQTEWESWSNTIEIGDGSYRWGVAYDGQQLIYHLGEKMDNVWDGSEITIAFPEYDEEMWASYDTATGLTIFKTVETPLSSAEFTTLATGNTNWEAGVTYKFVADTAVTPANDAAFAYYMGNDVTFGVGYITEKGGYVKYDDYISEDGWVEWDGSPYFAIMPDTIDSRSNRYRQNVASVPNFVTASTFVEDVLTSTENYEMINGGWSTRYKQVVMSQTDYTNLTTKDAHTIYNITGSTS